MYLSDVLKPSHVTNFVCSLFVGALIVSNFQVSLLCFADMDSGWFTIASSMMAEEENEESEKEEKEEKESTKDWISFYHHLQNSTQLSADLIFGQLHHYQSVCREVLSPPPDSKFTFQV